MRHLNLYVEFMALFIGLPLAVALIDRPFHIVFMPMLAVFAYALWWLFGHRKKRWHECWYGTRPDRERKQLKRVLIRFAVCAFLLLGLVLLLFPDNFLNFPHRYPLFFLLFIVLYPLFSVLPQELLYRSFLFERYRIIFNKPYAMVLVSSLAFAYVHIIFHSYIAVLFTLVGGYFFAQSYRETGSLRLIVLEHSLYGLLVFGLGFGGFFIRGLKEAGLLL